jgi:hypothetical protein
MTPIVFEDMIEKTRAAELDSTVHKSGKQATNHWLKLLVKPKCDVGVNTFKLDEVVTNLEGTIKR